MSHLDPHSITSQARLRRSMILSALGPGFVFGNSHENFPVGHPSWECSRPNLLNFGVPMEPEASELPKGIVLGRDGNIHIRLTGSISMGDVGCYNPPSLEARHPRRHTSGHGLALIPNCHISSLVEPMCDVGCYNPTPLGAQRPRRHTFGQGLALIPNCHISTRTPPHPRLDSVVARYCPLWAPATPSQFCFWELTQELPNRSPILGMLSPELA
ncbi:hypothetical protein DVH24_017981 [Malus domestica]|uniref:Uncharacterized protein n=1 Tax=Malus domestica TaxID=3750 RepID=A0A498KCP3_MALDO|nr:hypothetical protein DVH24_017981 [Malus domestica]